MNNGAARVMRRPAIPRRACSVALVVCVLVMELVGCSTAPDFDILISGGSVVDGTGAPPRGVDVGIKGDRIVAVGDLGDRRASIHIDATGKTITPGFIDSMGRSGVSLLANGLGESHLRQGITTEILGDASPAFWTPATANQDALRLAGAAFDWSGLNGYFSKLASRGTAINVGTLAPLSLASGGAAAFVDAAMRDGAWGVIDDADLTAADLEPVATAVGRSNGVLMLPVGSMVLASDDSFFAIGGAAHRVVVTDIARVEPGAPIAALNERMARATERNIAVYGTIVPSPQPVAGSSIPEALHYGGVMVATNTEATTLSHTNSPPAAFGAFPRLLGQMVQDDHVMELREAIRRSTSLPATVFGITQRGIIRDNYFADIVVFDAAAIADRSTFEKPNQYPAGVDYVIVNGVITVTPRGLTGARPGSGLLRNKGRR
jgi:N-acyl-D-aspartate/D-glutamate deacylase